MKSMIILICGFLLVLQCFSGFIYADTIESSILAVEIDNQFPRIMAYTWKPNGAVMYGQEDSLSLVEINGVSYSPTVSYAKTADQGSYTLVFSGIDVEMDIAIKVTGAAVELKVTAIRELGYTEVMNLAIPQHGLLSVRSNQPGAFFSGARAYYQNDGGSGDTFQSVAGNPAVDASPKNYMYAILNTDQLAGAIWTNAISEYTEDEDNERLQKQTVDKGGYYRTAVWSGTWTYRISGMPFTDPLPVVKVALSGDANGDGTVNWQDGAIAFRNIMNTPHGSERIPQLVVQRIPFNFASQATNPFLKTLDETKRLYLYTDGLGQSVLLKGYQAEGHDQAHCDYGNHIGRRMGGSKDMNTLVNIGKEKYNAFFGVHVSATGSNPDAYVFSEDLININYPGWDWLDISYNFDRAGYRREASTGNRLARLEVLKNEVPGLDFIYYDAWFEQAWDGIRLARETRGLDWTIYTEFPFVLENDAVWFHWSVDFAYGGPVNYKGFNSQIVRFIRNHQKDIWIARHPLLGGTEMADFEGWQGRVNIEDTIAMTFNTNLPTKYIQHFPIIRWEENSIGLEDNVRVSSAGGQRTITKDGKTVLTGDTYLLPWNPRTEDKLYHWNQAGGYTSWELPASWSGFTSVRLYRLTDRGRIFEGYLNATGGQLSIEAAAATPYVVYKQDAPPNPEMNWGEGSQVKDPGFNAGNLSQWTVTGDVGTAAVERNSNGQYELIISGGDRTVVSQTVSGLEQGTYAASVYVEVAGSRRAVIGVKDYGGPEVSNYTETSFAKNYISADSKHSTNMQRMQVYFDVPPGQTSATLYLAAEKGTATVKLDDVLLVPAVRPPLPAGACFAEDFENVVQGWYPFVKGPAGGITDPRTHLAELHAPYTQKGWNGKAVDDVISGNWSLKVHGEARGLVYRSLPQTLRFLPGRWYKVSFQYETEKSAVHGFAIGEGTQELMVVPIEESTSPKTFVRIFQATGNSWVGIKKLKGDSTDFILDNLVVEDLGSEAPVFEIAKDNWALVYVDSEETVGSDGKAVNFFDDNPLTLWATKWYGGSDPLPHEIQIDLGSRYEINELRYLPRQDSNENGRIAGYEVYVAETATYWGNPVAAGTFANDQTEKGISITPTTGRYVRLVALSEVNGQPWTSGAELRVFQTGNTTPPPPSNDIPKLGWSLLYVDSEELVGGNGGAANLFDDSPGTIWHTEWYYGSPQHPHEIQIDMGGVYQVQGFRYLPRQDGNQNGRIKEYEFYVSTDPNNWGQPVASGNFANTIDEKEITFPAAVEGRYLRLIALSEVNGNPWTAGAELTTFHSGAPLPPVDLVPKSGWSLRHVDSEEQVGGNGRAINFFDADPDTIWHTQWYTASPPYPHEIQIDMGSTFEVHGFRYLPRQDGNQNGRIKEYAFYLSLDPNNWGNPVATGSFANTIREKQASFEPRVARYLRLVALSEVNGNPWTSGAEITLLGVEKDITPPQITPPADILLELKNPAGMVVELGIPLVVDDIDPSPTVSNDAPEIFALGITEVTWTVTDKSGNSSTAKQSVTVVDTTPPEITAGFVPLNTDDEEGLYAIEFGAVDIGDSDPEVRAKLNVCGREIEVSTGQRVEVELEEEEECEFEWDDGILEIEASRVFLQVTAVDFWGNQAETVVELN